MSASSKAKFALFSIFALALASLAYAHFFLQNYLFMKPCEQCVYIRFAMLVLCLSALFALCFYPFKVLFLGFVCLGFFALLLGFYHSFTLLQIYEALANGELFGIKGCSSTARFAFDLPLDRLLPSLFELSGVCGFDAPLVPKEANLSSLQEFFIGTRADNFSEGLYSKGWFLLPSLKFISMASGCLILFFLMSLALFYALWLYSFKNLAKITGILASFALALVLFFLAY